MLPPLAVGFGGTGSDPVTPMAGFAFDPVVTYAGFEVTLLWPDLGDLRGSKFQLKKAAIGQHVTASPFHRTVFARQAMKNDIRSSCISCQDWGRSFATQDI